jgi:hypothetical protein
MEKAVCSVINVLMKKKCKKCSSEELVKNGKNRSEFSAICVMDVDILFRKITVIVPVQLQISNSLC